MDRPPARRPFESLARPPSLPSLSGLPRPPRPRHAHRAAHPAAATGTVSRPAAAALLGLFSLFGLFAGLPTALPGAGVAQAAPYCLMSKPQFGRPPQCREFYLADTARTDAGTLAVVAGAACVPTPIAQRQGWMPDARFPGPHATQQIGDLAMHAASPYHQDAYGCRAAMAGGSSGGSSGGGGVRHPGGAGGGFAGSRASQCSAPSQGCQLQQVVHQPQQRDAGGRLTVEAALVHVLNCQGRQRLVFQYLDRPGFRAIEPPNWGQPLGGRDFGTCTEAQTMAAHGGPPQAAGGGYYVFVLKDIGLVVATAQTVQTRPGCHWSGGGPRPCQTPATVLGALAGPYANENAARADMRQRLDCQRGHWGTFVTLGNGRAWLQNNLSASDCRSVKQL